jgi:hypothetical protein
LIFIDAGVGRLTNNTNHSIPVVRHQPGQKYEPLSYIYLIYNHGSFTDPNQLKQSEDHAIFKISYLKQF